MGRRRTDARRVAGAKEVESLAAMPGPVLAVVDDAQALDPAVIARPSGRRRRRPRGPDLLQAHDETGISLDDWLSARLLVELLIGKPILEKEA